MTIMKDGKPYDVQVADSGETVVFEVNTSRQYRFYILPQERDQEGHVPAAWLEMQAGVAVYWFLQDEQVSRVG